MAEKCTGMVFLDPTNTIEIKRNGDFFVDDLDIGVTADAIKDKSKSTATCLQEDEKIHSLVLNGIGHCLNPIKTSYYDLVFKRDGVRHDFMSSKENPGELSIQIKFDGDKKKIKRLEPHVTSKALGVYLAPNGKYTKQYQILDKKLKKWARKVKALSLSPREKLVAYHGYILRGIIYIISATSFTKQQCEKLQKIIFPILYNAFRIQSNANRTPLYTPKSLGGYGIIPIYHLQGAEKLKFYFMHRRLNDTTGKLLNISTRFIQMELGTSTSFWRLNYNSHEHYITETWITDIWRYLRSCGAHLVDNEFWIYTPPRENDFHLMDIVLKANLSIFQKQVFNQIRLFMKIITASDLINAKTNKVKRNIIGCHYPLTSTFGFPNVKKFPKHWIQIWNSIISTIILPKLRNAPLGRCVSFSHLNCNSTPTSSNNTNKEDVQEYKINMEIDSPAFIQIAAQIQTKISQSPRWMTALKQSST